MARGAEAGIDLTFHNPRDELAFYWSTGKASLTWARWQRLLCGTVWSLQCFKLVLLSVQLPLARARLLWVLAFTATTVCLEFSAAVLSLLRPSWSILHHETIKVAVQLCNCTTVLVGVFMSNPEDYLIKSPLAAMLCLAAVQVFGQMRLATAANVYPIAAAMHALMQISQWATEAPGAATSHPIGNILTHLLLGVALPVMASGAMEARSRHDFLIRHHQPLSKLGLFWGRVFDATCALERSLQDGAAAVHQLQVIMHQQVDKAICSAPACGCPVPHAELAGFHAHPIPLPQPQPQPQQQQQDHELRTTLVESCLSAAPTAAGEDVGLAAASDLGRISSAAGGAQQQLRSLAAPFSDPRMAASLDRRHIGSQMFASWHPQRGVSAERSMHSGQQHAAEQRHAVAERQPGLRSAAWWPAVISPRSWFGPAQPAVLASADCGVVPSPRAEHLAGGQDNRGWSSGEPQRSVALAHILREGWVTAQQDDDEAFYNLVLGSVGTCLAVLLGAALVEKLAPEVYSHLVGTVWRCIFGS